MPKRALYAFYLWDNDDYLVGVFTAGELARRNGTRVNSVHHQISIYNKQNKPIWLAHRIKCRVYIYYESFSSNKKAETKEEEEIENSIKEYKALYKKRHLKEKKENEKNSKIANNNSDVG